MSISPTNLFARIETMKKWQMEHQHKLLQQQSQQTKFLCDEQRRMQDAFGEKQNADPNEEQNQSDEEQQLPIDIDELPIQSPSKDFNMILEENLNRSSSPIIEKVNKPKQPFLRKGSGLSRFKMTLNKREKIKITPKPIKIQTPKPEIQEKISEPTWKSSESNYNSLLTELCNARQNDPELFNTPNNQSNINQSFERDLLDELKLFEALEQKVSNSSFCSNSSLVQRLMEHPNIRTPQKKQLRFFQSDDEESIASPRKPEKIIEESEESDEEDETDSVNSDDVSDTPQKINKIYRDAATNTDFAEPINPELLRTRLEELETEIETFRAENSRINSIKLRLEQDQRNLEKQQKQLRSKIEEEKQQMLKQLNDDKIKLSKDKQVYDKYIRESREGRSLRQKDREELSALRNHLSALQEEMKQKESKWGATHARLRNQVRHLEKESTSLKIENQELRSKNGKLEATNKQLLARRPSDTKVLHEINRNLTKLAQPPTLKTDRTPKTPKNDRSPKNDENRNSLDSNSTQSFDQIEREYEKMFGNSTRLIPATTASNSEQQNRDETVLDDGTVQIKYSNGNLRTISPNGKSIVMKYHNGDVKETCKNSGTVRYLYADAQVWHTTYPDGLELLEFANGQIEKRFRDGSTEILFPNGCRRCTTPNGSEEVSFPDGTNLFTKPETDEKILTLPNGQKEIHTSEHKRREYPDGTVKLLYPDGIQETRYANGRIRLKDKDGNLIMDSANV